MRLPYTLQTLVKRLAFAAFRLHEKQMRSGPGARAGGAASARPQAFEALDEESARGLLVTLAAPNTATGDMTFDELVRDESAFDSVFKGVTQLDFQGQQSRTRSTLEVLQSMTAAHESGGLIRFVVRQIVKHLYERYA